MSKARKSRTQAERTAASDSKMFKAAIKLIAKEGPHKMTHAKLGKVAGFSSGMVSYRFGTKSNLLIETLDRICELWVQRVTQSTVEQHLTGIDRLKNMCVEYVDAIEKKSDLMMAFYRLMTESYSALKELQPTFQESDRNFREVIAQIIREGQEEGSVDAQVSPETISMMIVAMLRGIAIQYFIDGKTVDLAAAKVALVQYCDQELLPT